MTNVFEQPWLLLIVAGVVFLGVFIFRDILPGKGKWLFWVTPVFIAGLAIGLDYFVRTDNEKIAAVIGKAVKAVEREDVNAIAPLISEDYQDSLNRSKGELLWHCRQRLSEPIIEKNVLRIVSLKVQGDAANAVFTVRTVFDQRGPIYGTIQQMVFKFEANFRKQGDDWFFTRAELLEIDMHPADWHHITDIDAFD
jgi:ketosteroid isomerase-like protein